MEIPTIANLVVNGKRAVVEVEVDGTTYQIRPLTIGERAQIKALSGRALGLKVNTGTLATEVEVNTEELLKATELQNVHILAAGLSVEKQLTSDEVSTWLLPGKVVQKLVEEILRISELSIDDIAPFRLFGAGATARTADSQSGGKD